MHSNQYGDMIKQFAMAAVHNRPTQLESRCRLVDGVWTHDPVVVQ